MACLLFTRSSNLRSLGPPGGAAVSLLVLRARQKTWPGGGCELAIGDASAIPFRKVMIPPTPPLGITRRESDAQESSK